MSPLIGLLAAADSTPIQWQWGVRWSWSPTATVLLIASLVVVVVYAYAREISPAGRGYRILLGILRTLSMALVLLMLTELMLTASRVGKPRLAVLIDRSASMATSDGIAAESGSGDASRLAAVQQLLSKVQPDLLQRWQSDYELSAATFAGAASEAMGADLAVSDWLSQLTPAPDTQGTRLGDAVVAAIESADDVAPAAVVVWTDGKATAGRSLAEAAARARRRGVPLFLVGVGSSTAPLDLRIDEALSDRVVSLGDSTAVSVTIAASTKIERAVKVSLTREGASSPVAVTEVQLGPQGRGTTSLVFTPDQVGPANYTLQLEPADGERELENNRRTLPLEVRDDPLRVLVAAGYPSYEFRFLKSLLERDRKFALTTYLQDADPGYTTADASAIGQLPFGTDAFDKFEAIVLIDLDPRGVPPLVWRNLERFVTEQGGGLLLAAGPRSYPWGYGSNATLARLSPIDLTTPATPRNDNGFTPALTPLGSDSPALRLAPTSEESRRLWSELPPLYWFADVGKVKPAAQVLLNHPRATSSAGTPVPLVVLQYVGAGRVVHQGFDESWRWRFRVGDVYFARYWGPMLRMLARGKLSADDSAPQLSVEEVEVASGEPVRIILRGASLAARDDATVSVEAQGQPPRSVTLRRNSGRGALQADLKDLPPGSYRAVVVQPSLPPDRSLVEFRVRGPLGELGDVALDEPALRAAAESTFGKYYRLADSAALAADLPRGQMVPRETLPPREFWNAWWLLAAVIACLASEWILRKRRAML